MPEEQVPNPPAPSPNQIGPVPVAKPAPGMGKADKASTLKFAEHSDFNFPLLILWLVAAFSILLTVYFWWNEKDLENTVKDKKAALSTIESSLTTKDNSDIEKEANDFKASVNALTSAYKLRYPYSTFLPNLYKLVNKDVVIDSMSVSSDGTMSMTGKTSSYRSVAEQVMSLKNSADLNGVNLASTSVAPGGGSGQVSFTIRANLVKNQNSNSAAGSTTDASTLPSPSSGGTQ